MSKTVKFVLSSLILSASLVGGTPKTAEACPQYYCCDAACNSVRYCSRLGSSCICEQHCTIRWDEW